jgi:hypothetical protein
MKDVEKLIGGYATGTLTDRERDALFAEALRNQALFDALADEEALRELLADPATRRQLLATLEQNRATLLEKIGAWLFRPLPMTLAAGVAAAGLAVVVIPRLTREPAREVAMVQPAVRPNVGAPAPAIPEAERPQPTPPPAKAPRLPPAAPQAVPVPPAEKRLEDAAARRDEREAPAARAVAAPADEPGPTLAAAPPAPPAAPAPAAVQVAKSSFAEGPPFDYALERQGAAGTWSGIEPTARLQENDQVRIALQARAPGWMSVSLRLPDGSLRSLFAGTVNAGARFHVPSQGGLPAARGDHNLSILHSSQGPSALGMQTAQGFRQAAGAEERARKTAVSLDEAAAAGAAPYTVEVTLRFR